MTTPIPELCVMCTFLCYKGAIASRPDDIVAHVIQNLCVMCTFLCYKGAIAWVHLTFAAGRSVGGRPEKSDSPR